MGFTGLSGAVGGPAECKPDLVKVTLSLSLSLSLSRGFFSQPDASFYLFICL